MILHELLQAPPPDLARALADFESRFNYPLGPSHYFRISHGEDYPRFFRAIGSTRSFITQNDTGEVIGALSVVICKLTCPDGSIQRAAYIGDLKVDPRARNSRTFIRLARAADGWVRPQVTAAFGVVMDGTRAIPPEYSGRAGIEPFFEAGKICILRFPTDNPHPHLDSHHWCFDEKRARARYRALCAGRYVTSGGNAAVRSESPPQWLLDPDEQACGRLEDTRHAKRLIDCDGQEIRSAHLACFAFSNASSAAQLIQIACHHAAARGFPALFVSVAHSDMPALESALTGIDRLVAPATIYAAGLRSDAPWNINTSEI